MFLADVIGTVVSPTSQVPDLNGRTLLLVRAVQPDGAAPSSRPRVAVDRIGAGVGDRVLVIDEGNSGRQLLDAPDAPIKTVVVGFVDSVEVGGRLVYDHAADDAGRPGDGQATGTR